MDSSFLAFTFSLVFFFIHGGKQTSLHTELSSSRKAAGLSVCSRKHKNEKMFLAKKKFDFRLWPGNQTEKLEMWKKPDKKKNKKNGVVNSKDKKKCPALTSWKGTYHYLS